MKNIISLLALIVCLPCQSQVVNGLTFTRTDYSLWRCQIASPPRPVCKGQKDTLMSNTQTNRPYHSWAVDPFSNTILMDGVVVGVINLNGVVIDVGFHFGFAVDRYYRGYLLCEQRDGDPYTYLFQVDVTTGNIDQAFGVVDFGNPNPVTGMVGFGDDW